MQETFRSAMKNIIFMKYSSKIVDCQTEAPCGLQSSAEGKIIGVTDQISLIRVIRVIRVISGKIKKIVRTNVS